MKTPLPAGLLGVVVALLGAGCTYPSSRPVIAARQANRIQTTDMGKIVNVRDVVIEGDRTRLGQYGGAAIGGAAALGGDGRIDNAGQGLAVAAAAVAGAVVGEATEEYLLRVEAQELTIELKNGSLITVTQPSPPHFIVGDSVQVIHGGRSARVVAASGG